MTNHETRVNMTVLYMHVYRLGICGYDNIYDLSLMHKRDSDFSDLHNPHTHTLVYPVTMNNGDLLSDEDVPE